MNQKDINLRMLMDIQTNLDWHEPGVSILQSPRERVFFARWQRPRTAEDELRYRSSIYYVHWKHSGETPLKVPLIRWQYLLRPETFTAGEIVKHRSAKGRYRVIRVYGDRLDLWTLKPGKHNMIKLKGVFQWEYTCVAQGEDNA